ncbi:MAG: hypothetical protein ABR530_09875, partial [Pyrinomonadaceae bacterium]
RRKRAAALLEDSRAKADLLVDTSAADEGSPLIDLTADSGDSPDDVDVGSSGPGDRPAQQPWNATRDDKQPQTVAAVDRKTISEVLNDIYGENRS